MRATGVLPDLLILWLPNDHTSGAKEDSAKPESQVADNDLAVGRVLDAVSHRPVLERDVHLCHRRRPASGLGPRQRVSHDRLRRQPVHETHAVVSTPYNTTSLLRTIELMLGLPPMNQMDATATPMFDCFTDAARSNALRRSAQSRAAG